MSLQVEKLEKNMAKLTIEVSAEELEKAIQGAYQKQKNRINIHAIVFTGLRLSRITTNMVVKITAKYKI